ncbi:STARP-like antigen [Schistosoma japonicum]|uniref:STARP-like antigen n=1 Tax=Schistosoma japonicum TaxID=6182 RepID=A0A4Z2D5I8_SCHJA|nr:STARP-like antigen [Schistosoma japonicum]TNN11736.1 STARP-like antigen [Schistosoma japonicum]
MKIQNDQNSLDIIESENNEIKHDHLIDMESHMKTCSRKGRKSTIPPELKEQTRRVQKKNIERIRRACIANKMSELHNLAMNMIGLNKSEQLKTEKVDILGMCYEVLKNVTILLNENPEMKEKLKQMCNEVGIKSINKQNDMSVIDKDSVDIISDKLSNCSYNQQSPSSWNKENSNPTCQNFLIPSDLSAFTPIRKMYYNSLQNTNQLEYHSTPKQLPLLTNDSGYYEMQSSNSLFHMNPINLQMTKTSNEYTYLPQTNFQCNSTVSLSQLKENIQESEKNTLHATNNDKVMWRPYLE